MSALKYAVKGPDEMEDFQPMLKVLAGTFAQRTKIGRPLLDFGHYANVLDLGNGQGLAISTDGVGTKLMVAKELRDYTSIGIDCIAMNVNDVICVGAEPIAMTDYIAVHSLDDGILAQLAVGLRKGAELAGITIPGGEIAQIPEMVSELDLVGTCIGLVQTDQMIVGNDLSPGDAIIGFASSGIHSNGLTLARDALIGTIEDEDERLAKYQTYDEDFGRTIGAELLQPTEIYVRLVQSLKSIVRFKALAHITSDGFLNLQRFEPKIGFAIDYLPEVPAVFQKIQCAGNVTDEEMYYVYNMGVGLCAVVDGAEVDAAIVAAAKMGVTAWRIGTCFADADKTVDLQPKRLRSHGKRLTRY
jgi:phosphoribosylformylglycinamidine cyclo-ligase